MCASQSGSVVVHLGRSVSAEGELWKVLGATAGALVGLAVIPPVTRREAVNRAWVSFVLGAASAPWSRHIIEGVSRPENLTDNESIFFAALTGAMASWWLIGAVVTVARSLAPKLPGWVSQCVERWIGISPKQ